MDPKPSGRYMFNWTPAEGRPAGSVANWAIIGIFIILAFQMLATARAFLMPVCLGVLLFFVFVPFRRWMARRGVAPGITAGIVVLGIVAGMAVLGWFASGPAGQLINEAPQISRQLKQRYEDFRKNFRGLERAAKGIEDLAGTGGSAPTVTATGSAGTVAAPLDGGLGAPSGGAAAPVPSKTTVTANAPGTGMPGNLTVEVTAPASGNMVTQKLMDMGPAIVSQLFFTLIFLFFLLASGDLLYLRIVQSFASLKDKRAAYEALREIENSLGNYLGAITIINVGLGVASGLAMWVLGMPSPLLWGVAAALLNYVPYIGAAIGYLGAFLVALVVFNDVWWALLVGGTYFSLTAIEGQFITPYFVSRRLQLNTVVVFLTVALWAWLWSILGMVVAVPMLVVVRVLADHIPGLERFGNFLAGEAPPAIADDESEGADGAGAAAG